MTFDEILEQVIVLLKRQGRVSYGALRRRYDLDEAYLEDLYFGYPQAHEDDAQRAVHTGLGIIDSLKILNTRLEADRGIRLSVRVGIHTGLVVVGEIGSGGRQEQLALGETPNLAVRISTYPQLFLYVWVPHTIQAASTLGSTRERYKFKFVQALRQACPPPLHDRLAGQSVTAVLWQVSTHGVPHGPVVSGQGRSHRWL